MPAVFSTKSPIIAVALLAFALVAHAEQIRVAVTVPVVVGETNGVGSQAALWQSLVVAELSRHDWFALVDREDLPLAAQEWALATLTAKGTSATAKPTWQGADLLVIGRLSLTNGLCALTVKVLDVQRGAIEETVAGSFPPAELETRARALADQLKPLGLRWLARRDIHTLASVLDFDLQGTLNRSRWAERAAAQRLRGFLQQQPGVLVLEREQVEELLAETRLRRGGLTVAGGANTNGWALLRHYQLISGTISETQPEGQPLTFRVQTRVRDLDAGSTNEFAESFPAAQWVEGMARVERQLVQTLFHSGNNLATSPADTNRTAEALALANQALRLTGRADCSSWSNFLRLRPTGMLGDNDYYWMFLDGGIGAQFTPQRQARILQAVRYLKAAVLADDQIPQLKLFLATLLTDRQVNERELAVELADEVGWRWPEFRYPAWAHAYNYSTGETQQRHLRRLIEYFPESHFAQLPAYAELAKFLEKHRQDSNLTAVVDAIQPHMEREITATRGDLIEGYVKRLFDYTQITGRNPKNLQHGYELQTPENRSRGVALLEEMIQRHPASAFFLCHFWSYYWDYYTDDDANICYWYQRAADVAPQDPKDRWNMSVWWDRPRLELARRWMAVGKFKDALPYLEKITNGHLEGERDLRIGQCAFETGDCERALKLFRAFGPDHEEASAWAAKCEQRLGLAPLVRPPKLYSCVTNRGFWKSSELKQPKLPRGQQMGAIRATVMDEDYLWQGMANGMLWADHNWLQLEKSPAGRTQALREGGLIRWNRNTGEAAFISTADGLPYPWVGALAVAPEGLWVGTLGSGLGLLDPRTGRWQVWTETNGLPMNYVRSLLVTGDTVWAGFGHLEHGGVARYSMPTKEWRTMLPGDFSAETNQLPAHLLANPRMPEHLKQPRIRSTVPISPVTALAVINNLLWCALPAAPNTLSPTATAPRGVIVFDLATNGWYQAFPDAPASFVRVGDRVWCSFGSGGLAHCDLRGGDWQRVTRADGLPFDPGPLCEWQGRLLIAGESLAMLDPKSKRFEVFPFPTPGGAGLMTVAGDQVYLVRGNQILSLDLSTLPPSSTAAP